MQILNLQILQGLVLVFKAVDFILKKYFHSNNKKSEKVLKIEKNNHF